MQTNSYGRIVNISSLAGLYGNSGRVNYSTMKRAAVGFTLALALEGEKHNIQANVIAPIAASRMTDSVMPEKFMKSMPADSVANFVAYLCHESCTSTSGIFELAGRWISKLRWERSQGATMPEGFSLDDVAERFGTICDFTDGTDHPPEEGSPAVAKALESTKAKL